MKEGGPKAARRRRSAIDQTMAKTGDAARLV
jgi:hypothetical protein